MKKSNLVILLLCVFAVSLLAGCVTTRPILAPKTQDTSWYGKSGAQPAPVKDANTAFPSKDPLKRGSWWMPNEAPAGKDSTIWGNKGYVYLSGEAQKPVVYLSASAKPGKKVVEKKVCVEKPASTNTRDVYFLFDSAELTPLAVKNLDKNVMALKENPKAKIVLMGYASPEGTDEYNLKLSERRALAVKDYLVKKGISEARLSVKAEGEMKVSKSFYPSARKVHLEIVTK